MKACKRCGILKDDSAFYKRTKAKDGLQAYCIDCVRAYRKDNRERINATHREWTKANPERVKEYSYRTTLRKLRERKNHAMETQV